MHGPIYEFEELGEEDLYRPPLAAQRALRCAGMLVTRAGWLAASSDVRLRLTWAGTRDVVDIAEVKALVDCVPLREVKLYPRWDDPSPYDIPEPLRDGLPTTRPIPLPFWQSIRVVDRHVLVMLSKNARLLWRALDELARDNPYGHQLIASQAWHGMLGRCELRMAVEIAQRLSSRDFMDGRAFVLARVAGVRAARRAADLLDLRSGVGTGPIELGCHAGWGGKGAMLIWQAHVSTAMGEFFPAASLLAATTSAVALVDMLGAEHADAKVTIDAAAVQEDRWMIGEVDEVTIAR